MRRWYLNSNLPLEVFATLFPLSLSKCVWRTACRSVDDSSCDNLSRRALDDRRSVIVMNAILYQAELTAELNKFSYSLPVKTDYSGMFDIHCIHFCLDRGVHEHNISTTTLINFCVYHVEQTTLFLNTFSGIPRTKSFRIEQAIQVTFCNPKLNAQLHQRKVLLVLKKFCLNDYTSRYHK